jgi:type VI secretion system protein ImpJ
MRRAPTAVARVVWEEGMHLAPQHFQMHRRHLEATTTSALDVLHAFPYGVASCEIDAEALRNGTLSLVHARGIFPDGTPFDMPEGDALPEESSLANRFSPTRDAHLVHLALPGWRSGAANVWNETVAVGMDAPAPRERHRFLRGERTVTDETTGQDPVSVTFAMRQCRLLLDDECTADDVTLPIGRVRRDGAGSYVLDPLFIPPCLRIGASTRLVELTHRLVGMLEAKGQALASTLAPSASTTGAAAAQAYQGNELATRWLLHAVRSAEAPLRHMLRSRDAHPEQLWLEVLRLAGALCTFSLSVSARDLPTYDHDAPQASFDAIERFLREQLDVVVTVRAVVAPLTQLADVLYGAPLADARCYEPAARWFLAVRSSVGIARTVALVPQLTKVCATKFVLELVKRAYHGLALEHVPSPPPAIAPRPEFAYFELTLDGPCAKALRDTREIGVYVPAGLPDIELQVAVLVPE